MNLLFREVFAARGLPKGGAVSFARSREPEKATGLAEASPKRHGGESVEQGCLRGSWTRRSGTPILGCGARTRV